MAVHARNINLDLEIDILTPGTIAGFVIEILEFLLYQRNQIPFVYNTYKYYIGKWIESDDCNADVRQYTNKQFHLQRQRQMAKQTKDNISDMREVIRKVFKSKAVKSLRFLFGSTTFTPKEVYTIHIPTTAITWQHDEQQHAIPRSQINQNLIALITCEQLYSIFSISLPITNVFLELELFDECPTTSVPLGDTKVFPKDLSQLPPSCKNIHLHLMHVQPDLVLERKCCRELQVYEDLKLKSFVEEKQNIPENNVNRTNNICYKNSGWWEADIVVRGFKEQATKAFNIWS